MDTAAIVHGAHACRFDKPKVKWKPRMEVVKATIDFLMQTGWMMPQEGWRNSQVD